jgi:hypothetical protein
MSLGGLGSGLFDFATSAWSMNEEQKYNTGEAQADRAFQKEMSDTSYQRAVKDLNAAGLSPMLAYSKGGASTPSGAHAAPTQGAKSDISGAMEKASTSELMKEQIQTQKSQQNLNNSSALKAQTEAYAIANQTSQGLTDAQIQQLKAAAAQHGATAEQLKALEDRLRQEININKGPERFATEEPEKAKWMSPIFQSLNEIFKGVGALRGNSATINTTTTYPDGSKSTKTTKRK